jgi:hypothetical protein
MPNFWELRWRRKDWEQTKKKYQFKDEGWQRVICAEEKVANSLREKIARDPLYEVEIIRK